MAGGGGPSSIAGGGPSSNACGGPSSEPAGESDDGDPDPDHRHHPPTTDHGVAPAAAGGTGAVRFVPEISKCRDSLFPNVVSSTPAGDSTLAFPTPDELAHPLPPTNYNSGFWRLDDHRHHPLPLPHLPPTDRHHPLPHGFTPSTASGTNASDSDSDFLSCLEVYARDLRFLAQMVDTYFVRAEWFAAMQPEALGQYFQERLSHLADVLRAASEEIQDAAEITDAMLVPCLSNTMEEGFKLERLICICVNLQDMETWLLHIATRAPYIARKLSNAELIKVYCKVISDLVSALLSVANQLEVILDEWEEMDVSSENRKMVPEVTNQPDSAIRLVEFVSRKYEENLSQITNAARQNEIASEQSVMRKQLDHISRQLEAVEKEMAAMRTMHMIPIPDPERPKPSINNTEQEQSNQKKGKDKKFDWKLALTQGLVEALGVFLLVLFSCGTTALSNHDPKALPTLAPSLVGGVVSFALSYTFGHVTGCGVHLNPLVTLCFAIFSDFPWKKVPIYIGAHLIGGYIAPFILRAILGNLNFNQPDEIWWKPFIVEIFSAMLYMLAKISMSTDSRAREEFAGFVVASTVVATQFFGGPVAGGSTNPVVSLGCAITMKSYKHLWRKMLGQAIGMLISSALYRFFFDRQGRAWIKEFFSKMRATPPVDQPSPNMA